MRDEEASVFAAVYTELVRARKKHTTPLHNLHEGYGVIAEEFREYFDEVCKQQYDPEAARSELVQVAAMAIRTILDVIEPQR